MSLTTLLIVVGVTALLVLAALAVVLLRDPFGLQRRIEWLFRRPEGPPKTAGDEQYYRAYWQR